MFQRRTSLVEYPKPALKKSLKAVQKFAEMEGLGAREKRAEAVELLMNTDPIGPTS